VCMLKQIITDEQIASKVQSGQIDLFGLLVQRYEEKLQRYAKKFLSQEEDISDVLQNIFIKVYKNINSFDSKRKFLPWIYRIAHNELVNELKKKKFLPLPLFEFDSFLPAFHKESNERELREKEFDFQKQKIKIEKCLKKLKPLQREILILYYFEGLDYKAIAEVTRQPISTVGVRLKRAKEKVKQLYPIL